MSDYSIYILRCAQKELSPLSTNNIYGDICDTIRKLAENPLPNGCLKLYDLKALELESQLRPFNCIQSYYSNRCKNRSKKQRRISLHFDNNSYKRQ